MANGGARHGQISLRSRTSPARNSYSLPDNTPVSRRVDSASQDSSGMVCPRQHSDPIDIPSVGDISPDSFGRRNSSVNFFGVLASLPDVSSFRAGRGHGVE